MNLNGILNNHNHTGDHTDHINGQDIAIRTSTRFSLSVRHSDQLKPQKQTGCCKYSIQSVFIPFQGNLYTQQEKTSVLINTYENVANN